MAAFRNAYTRLRSNLHHTLSHLYPIPNLPSPILHSPPPILLSHLYPNPTKIPNPNFPILRHLSTLRRPNGARTVDIGARARQIQKRRLWSYGLSFACVAGFIVIVLSTFQDQMVFYVTPTDALQKFSLNPSKTRFRLGGLVLEGSVSHPASSKEMEFVVTDLVTDILVRYEGMLPDLFREGHSVVVEGFMTPFSETEEGRRSGGEGRGVVTEKARSGNCYFTATEVLAKHDEKYMPREVAVAINKNKAKIEADALEKEEEKRNEES